jgi:predicted dehydrogenase
VVTRSLDELAGIADRSSSPDLAVGVVGAGWIVRECHLPAYRNAGIKVVAIASRQRTSAAELAAQFGIGSVHESWQGLLDDCTVEIVDIAFPPDRQPEVILEAIKRSHIKGILAQKPLALDLETAREVVAAAEDAGVTLAVNQNMRYDRSIRAAKAFLDAGRFGKVRFAHINMHAPVTWMDYARDYQRKGMLIMSIHHLDAFRFLFGDPESIIATVTGPADAPAEPPDESAAYILEYASGLRAIAIDNCHSWADIGIDWRIEGTDGIAKGTVGWPDFPWGSPSTFDYVSAGAPQLWYRPRWPERWFPDAFAETMAALMHSVVSGTDGELSGRDNLRTMALLEAAYLSARERRAQDPIELLDSAERNVERTEVS